MEVLDAMVAGIFGLLTFLLGRFLSKDRLSESLARKNALMDLLAKMRREGVDDAQLKSLEQDFEKREVLRASEDRILAASYNFGMEDVDEATTQLDINLAQGRRLQMLNARLNGTLTELKHYLGPEEQALLSTTQDAWGEFREAEAKWIARIWKGGSIWPFIVYAEESRLTVERLAALDEQLRLERENSSAE